MIKDQQIQIRRPQRKTVLRCALSMTHTPGVHTQVVASVSHILFMYYKHPTAAALVFAMTLLFS